MKKALTGFLILSSMLWTAGLVWADASPVVLTHTVTGYGTGDKTVTVDVSVHVENPGDTYLSNVTLSFVPMPPFVRGRSTLNVGSLAPRQSADFSLHLEAPAIGKDKVARRPLFFAGKYDDANGTKVEFPVTSHPGDVNEVLYLQNEPSPSGASPNLYQSSAQAAPGDFLFKWGNLYPATPINVAVDSAGYVYVSDIGNNMIQIFDSSGNFVRSLGSYGSGNGQFKSPYGVAVDSAGNVYVADSGNSRIQAFDNGGNFLRTWGSYGVENGQFDGLTGLTVDSAGNVYAADTGNYRIQVFDSGGNFLRTFGSGQVNDPEGVAVDKGGNVYVADSNSQRIQVFDRYGNFVRSWGSFGSGDGQFYIPEGVAVDKSGNVYVADTYNNRIQVFGIGGNFVMTWGSYGSGNGQLSRPFGVAVDSGGNVCVADTYNSRIQIFTANGTFLSGIDRKTADGSFYQLSGVAIDNGGNVYVADTGNSRIQVFDSGGNFMKTWGGYGSGNGQFEYPEDVAVDANGNIYVADFGNNRIEIFDNSGIFVRRIEGSVGTELFPLTGPYCVAVDANGNTYVGDSEGFGRLLVFDNSGTFVRIDGRDSVFPRGIAVESNGNVYVPSAHDYGGRVKVYDSTGTFLKDIGESQFKWLGGGIAVDTISNIYVTDWGFPWFLPQYNSRVLVFDTTGSFKGAWSSEGCGEGQLHSPTDVAVNTSGAIVYVGDSGNNRIQAFAGFAYAILPVTTATPTGTLGSNGWYVSDVGVSLSATDTDSVVKDIHYKVDGGAYTVTSGSAASFTLNTEAKHTVVYYAVDNSWNQEASHSLNVNIDKTAPTVTASASPSLAKANNKSVLVTVSGNLSDAISGPDMSISSGSYAVSDSAGTNNTGGNFTVKLNPRGKYVYSFAVSLSTSVPKGSRSRTYTITVRSKDKAGNIGAANTKFVVR